MVSDKLHILETAKRNSSTASNWHPTAEIYIIPWLRAQTTSCHDNFASTKKTTSYNNHGAHNVSIVTKTDSMDQNNPILVNL